MSYPYEKKKIDPWMIFGIGSLVTVSAYYTFFRGDDSKEIENKDLNASQPKAVQVIQSPETMTFLGSELSSDQYNHPIKFCYFDTDNDLSTAEIVKEVSLYTKTNALNQQNATAAYNLKRGDVVQKNDWTHIVRRAQEEKIRE